MTHDDETVERIEKAISSLEEFAGPHTPPHRRARSAADGLRAALSALPPRELLREALTALDRVLLNVEFMWEDGALASDAVADLRRARAAAEALRKALGEGQS